MIAIIPDSLDGAVKLRDADLGIRPSWLSPLTAMSVRYAIDSRDDAEVVAVRITDAMAAISGRSLAGRKPRITVRVLPNSAPPKGIPADVRQGVDRWLFPSQRMRSLYPADLKNAVVDPEIDMDFDGLAKHGPQSHRYLWIGPINGNTERLKQAIKRVDALAEDATLDIYGEGKARNVMPAVRLARAIEHPARIKWAGRQFSADDLDRPVTTVFQAGLDPTPLELRLQRDGLPLLDVIL